MDPILVGGLVEVVVLLLLHRVLVVLHMDAQVAMFLPGAHGKVDHTEGEVVVVGEGFSECIVEQTVVASEKLLGMKTYACFAAAAERTNRNQMLGSYEVLAAAEVQLLRKHWAVSAEPEAASAEKCTEIGKHHHATQNPIFLSYQFECLATFLL